MEIGLAKEDDINQILNLQTQIYRIDKIDESAANALKKQLTDKTCEVLVAKDEGTVVGTAAIYYIEVAVRARPYAFLEGLVVDKNSRGKGVATKLFSEMIKLAREKNCYKIIFTSSEEREEAHNLYTKLGFKKWGLEFRMNL